MACERASPGIETGEWGADVRVLLVTPPFDTIREGYGSRFRIKRGNAPPLGIGYLAAVLRGAGHPVDLVDMVVAGLTIDQALERAQRFGAELICLSTMTATKDQAYELARAFRARLAVPLLMGGAHPTCFPMDVLRECPEVDYVAVGEGEKTILGVVDRLSRGEDLSGIRGLYTRDGVAEEQMIAGEAAEDLDLIPFPPQDLYQRDRYAPLPSQSRQLPATIMISSRGCPYGRCRFCFQAGRYRQRYRRRSPQNVTREVLELKERYGFREFAFWDDNFTVNPKWIREFCQLLGEAGTGMTWSCIGRVDTVTREMLQTIAQAGCFSVYYGFETGNQDLLDLIRKGTTLEQAEEAVLWTREAGMEIRGSFMLALPGETPEKGEKTIQFALQLDPDYIGFMPFRPVAGTELYEIAVAEGRELPYPKKGIHQATYLPQAYQSIEQVEALVRQAYRRFYLRPSYVWRRLKSVGRPSELGKYYEGLKLLLGITSS
jgi:anaerobic magnesium-protoporphyrin IX monomethyl ester cyclase